MTWALVILGWWIVHAGALRRARRQEDLDAIGKIDQHVAALRDKAVQYHTGDTPEGERIQGCHLRYEMQSLVRAVRILRLRHPNRYDVTGEMMSLRIAITTNNFDTNARVNVAHDDPIINGIWIATGDLMTRLREEFEATTGI